MQEELSNMPSSILDAAANATSLINSGFGGHVRVYPDRILWIRKMKRVRKRFGNGT